MIPAAFDYERPESLDEALRLLAEHGEDAKVLAGGHSLLPAMKLRLAQPGVVIDIGRIDALRSISKQGRRIALGALATHYEIESSKLLTDKCPLLPEVAAQIGDVQIRNRGTIGGSLVHADPAADWPAAILALDAEMEIAGRDGIRTVAAKDFFVNMMETAVKPSEILVSITVPVTRKGVAYAKFAQKASGFAIAGAAVWIEGRRVAVGITGVAARAYRAAGVEAALGGRRSLKAAAIEEASRHVADNVEPLGDIHASAEFRAHLARVYTVRALEMAISRK